MTIRRLGAGRYKVTGRGGKVEAYIIKHPQQRGWSVRYTGNLGDNSAHITLADAKRSVAISVV